VIAWSFVTTFSIYSVPAVFHQSNINQINTHVNCILVSNVFMRLRDLIFCPMIPSRRSNPATCADASVTSFTCRSTVWLWQGWYRSEGFIRQSSMLSLVKCAFAGGCWEKVSMSANWKYTFMVGRWNKRMELLRRSFEELSLAAELETHSLRRAITLVTTMLLICSSPSFNIAINNLSGWAKYPFLCTASRATSRISSLDRLLILWIKLYRCLDPCVI